MEEIGKFLKKESLYNPNLPSILQNQTVYRQKANFITTSIFKQSYLSQLGEILEKTPFSITTDEVTTKSKAGGGIIFLQFVCITLGKV